MLHTLATAEYYRNSIKLFLCTFQVILRNFSLYTSHGHTSKTNTADRSLTHSKSLSSSTQHFSKTRAHRNVLMQSLKRGIDNEYEHKVICYNIIDYLNEMCEYRLSLVFTAKLPVLGVSRLLPRPAIYGLRRKQRKSVVAQRYKSVPCLTSACHCQS